MLDSVWASFWAVLQQFWPLIFGIFITAQALAFGIDTIKAWASRPRG